MDPAGFLRPGHRRWGSRGEGWVAAQFVLMAIVAAGPWVFGAAKSPAIGAVGRAAGFVLLGIGVIGGLAGALSLGSNLTPFPRPQPNGTLVTTGAYAIVRHPIYTAVLLVSAGWALAWQSLPTLGVVALLLLLFDRKSRREEIWLVERFDAYADYQRRVRKLIPFVY